MYNLRKLATFKANTGEVSTLHTATDGVNPDHKFESSCSKYLTEVFFRRVKRDDSAIQINVRQYNKLSNRTKFICFSIPENMCDLFLELLKSK